MGLKRGRGTDSVDGNKLFRKTLGAQQLTPQKFRRQLKTVTLREGVQVDYSFPTTLNGDRVYVDLNQNDQQYEGATLTTVDETLLTGNDLISYKRTGDAQTETVNERLVKETDPPPLLSALVTTMSQEAIGDGKSLLTYGVVPYVFPNNKWEASRATLIPAEFTFLVPEASYTFTEAGIAMPIPLPLPLGTTSASDEQIDVFRHRLKTGVQDFFAPGVLPITIVGSRTTKEKQVEHIEKTLQLSSVTPAPPTSVLDVTWQNLGNGAAIEEHDFVDSLFTEQKFESEIEDVIPHKFKALVPIETTSSVSEGTAGPPTMLTGDLKRTSEQVNVFVVRNTRIFRDVTGLPVSLPGYRMTAQGQVADTLATIATGLQTITPDFTFVEAEVENLGNNTSIKTQSTVAAVFPDDSYTTSILNLIPEKLRAAVKMRESSIDSAIPPDISVTPVLLTGELERTEKRIGVFRKRIMLKKIDPTTIPTSVIDHGFTEENGGATTTITHTLNAHGALPVETGLMVLKSEVIDLGNGYDVRTTEIADVDGSTGGWPALLGQEYDERLNVVLPFVQEVKARNADFGSPYVDIKPRTKWKQDERGIDPSSIAAVLDAYVLAYPAKVNVDMPDILLGVTGVIETAFGEGINEETGSFSIGASANFSVSQALNARAQSSASLIPDVTPDIVQFWGNNLDAMHYGFYLSQPVTPAAVLAKITALIGSPVNNWPKFSPKSVTITAKGMKASVQSTASSQGSASQSTCGTSCPSATSTAAGGTGFSHEQALNLKTVRISPTIHGALTIGGPHTASQLISARAQADAHSLGPPEDHTEYDTVTAEIYNGVSLNYAIPASPGATTWPSSGPYLFKLDGQPYRYGYVQFHAIIVDAANFPTPT